MNKIILILSVLLSVNSWAGMGPFDNKRQEKADELKMEMKGPKLEAVKTMDKRKRYLIDGKWENAKGSAQFDVDGSSKDEILIRRDK